VNAHELARELLLWPDVPVVLVGEADRITAINDVCGLSKLVMGRDVNESPVGNPWETPKAILLH
jgi:hypothetical protein